MSHPNENDLVLLVYGELPRATAERIEDHLGRCASCHAQFLRLDQARAGIDVVSRGLKRRRVATAAWTMAALAVAATIAVVVWHARPGPGAPPLSFEVPRYVAPDLAPIDSALTRLEQEPRYAIP